LFHWLPSPGDGLLNDDGIDFVNVSNQTRPRAGTKLIACYYLHARPTYTYLQFGIDTATSEGIPGKEGCDGSGLFRLLCRSISGRSHLWSDLCSCTRTYQQTSASVFTWPDPSV